jgi:prepilin-type N-terminal cleavage/methylation domain-containing protein
MNKKRGFTLIELLVVIAIIGVLSSLVLSSLNKARDKARMSKRISEMKQAQTALELYYTTNGTYPNTASDYDSAHCASILTPETIPGLVPVYLTRELIDPLDDNAGANNCYIYISDGRDYKLIDYNLSDVNLGNFNNQPFKGFRDPARGVFGMGCSIIDSAHSLAIYTSGGQCW